MRGLGGTREKCWTIASLVGGEGAKGRGDREDERARGWGTREQYCTRVRLVSG